MIMCFTTFSYTAFSFVYLILSKIKLFSTRVHYYQELAITGFLIYFKKKKIKVKACENI